MSQAAAFFDLDKTLMEGSSAMAFARALYGAGIVSRRQLASDGWKHLRYRLEGATDDQADEVRKRVLEDIEGTRELDMRRLRPEVLRNILPLVYPQMLATAHAHQDAGRPCYIVTAASQDLAGLLAQVFVLDGGIGARYEVRDGLYTGRPDGPFTYGEGKVLAMRALAEREGIDLAASYAYSDSASDLPMLRCVGNPVAVNPDASLEEVARAEGWEIMRFDKLGRRLKIVRTAGTLAIAAAAGGYVVGRLRERFG